MWEEAEKQKKRDGGEGERESWQLDGNAETSKDERRLKEMEGIFKVEETVERVFIKGLEGVGGGGGAEKREGRQRRKLKRCCRRRRATRMAAWRRRRRRSCLMVETERMRERDKERKREKDRQTEKERKREREREKERSRLPLSATWCQAPINSGCI